MTATNYGPKEKTGIGVGVGIGKMNEWREKLRLWKLIETLRQVLGATST